MEQLSGNYRDNVERFNTLLGVGRNMDMVSRDYVIGGRRARLWVVDGYGKDETLERMGAFWLSLKPEDVQGLGDGSEMSTVLEDYAQIFDLAAENVEAYLAVNIVCTAISEAEQALYDSLTEEETIDATLENRDMILESYAQAGMVVESMEKVEVTFLGQPHFAIRTAAYSGDIPIYMLQVMDYTQGTYGVTLTATSYLEDNTQQVLEMFYAVK